NKEYLGGAIAPGPYTSLKALGKLASQLPENGFEFTDKIDEDLIEEAFKDKELLFIDKMDKIDRVKAEILEIFELFDFE
ncbi:MAG: type III pantothenate kinase, partial [Methanobrevibacter sp.]|nr:type III pantothenate kinase [Methanobrevibacter sp.]